MSDHLTHQISIRAAAVADVPQILAVHRAAVLEGAANSYDIETRHAWAADQSPAWITRLTDALTSGTELILVATQNDRVIAFGSIIPAESELRALYVDSACLHRGVGSRLLNHLELLAIKWGITALSFDASINAQAFYAKHGYQELVLGSHRLSNGVSMPCIRMRKELS